MRDMVRFLMSYHIQRMMYIAWCTQLRYDIVLYYTRCLIVQIRTYYVSHVQDSTAREIRGESWCQSIQVEETDMWHKHKGCAEAISRRS